MSMVEQVRAALESYRLDSVSADEARVAIEAMREPDMAMISAAVSAAEKSGPGDFVAIWHAMLTAALGKE